MQYNLTKRERHINKVKKNKRNCLPGYRLKALQFIREFANALWKDDPRSALIETTYEQQ